MTTSKRENIKLLPAYHQTDTLRKFFGATIDHLFQSGETTPINGFIGRAATSDSPQSYYVTEPTAERQAYQLEAGMVSYDSNGKLSHALAFDDFCNYLSNNGADLSDHNKLFETDHYSWCPPIDIDKLINYHKYFWIGNLPVSKLPIINVVAPYNHYIGDGLTKTFVAPSAITTVIGEAPTISIDGVIYSVTVDSSGLVTSPIVPPRGSSIFVSRYNDLLTTITTTPDITGLNPSSIITKLSSGMLIRVIDAVYLAANFNTSNLSTTTDTSRTYFVEGIGNGVRMVALDSMVIGAIPAQYTTIDRSSHALNSWSGHNFWVHIDTISWAGNTFTAQQAIRPIIEFVRDILLIDGQAWSLTTPPLFRLFDIEGIALDDPTKYPQSTFSGNRIFGYKYSTTNTVDPIIGHALTYDNNEYIVFSNEIAVNSNGAIYGYSLFGVSDIQYCWHPCSNQILQTRDAKSYWSIPACLERNPEALEVADISKSDWYAHFNSIITGQTGFSGIVYAGNNWRDSPRDLSVGTEILQHRGSLLRSMLTASDTRFDMSAALRYAENEYARYRNKFLQKASQLNQQGVIDTVSTDAATLVLLILQSLKTDRNNSFPFSLSTMAGGKYFIPSTPASFGITPLVVPAIIIDNNFYKPFKLILGHDGSKTLAHNDWRDGVLLALETMIYQHTPDRFKNNDSRPVFDYQAYVGGKYFTPTNGYTWQQSQTILETIFESWAQANRIAYRENTQFDDSDYFTWNFHGCKDVDGETVPCGHWRGLYAYYFDTDTPHTTPWQMLGFANQPSWWNAQYGPAPYERTNIAMWDDIAAGQIAQGSRQGIDPRYVRPNLLNVLPVDNFGNLLDPVSARIIVNPPSQYQAAGGWLAGDYGPVEQVWRMSPSYWYAIAQAEFLLKPTRFIEQTFDTDSVGYIGKQWVNTNVLNHGQRPQNSKILMHGEQQNSVNGSGQWLADFLTSMGMAPTLLGNALRGLSVRLIHKMAGFVASDAVQASTESFGLIPAEDVQTVLYQSPAILHEVYSGVILQVIPEGWKVIGYDLRDPVFNVMEPDIYGPRGILSLNSTPQPAINDWYSSTYYPLGVLVVYKGSIYKSIRSHTSGKTFEQVFWTGSSEAVQQTRQVTTYLNTTGKLLAVPYQTVFATFQEVADFLLGYERYLESRGWVFDQIDPDTSLPINWSQSVIDFLGWTQVRWASGNFIALSPAGASPGLHFNTPVGTILNVEDNITGFFGLLDRGGSPIDQRQVNITRLDGDVTLTSGQSGIGIFCARVQIAIIEHALIFSNITIFNDAINMPLYNLRHARVRLVGAKTAQWNGRLDAPGYIISGNKLLPNFDKTAEDVRLAFDIEKSDRSDLRAYARHLVGFQQRDYLQNLLLSEVEQFEFYQGMIQQKGAPGVFNTLLRNYQTTSSSPIEFLEEWAIKVADFGRPRDPRLTIQARQIEFRNDPQFIRLTQTVNAPPTWIELAADDSRWFDKPSAGSNFFELYPMDTATFLPTAGPVRLNEVSYAVPNATALQTLFDSKFTGNGIASFPVTSRIWVYDGSPDGTYMVYKVCNLGPTSANAISKVITHTEDNTVGFSTKVVMVSPHGLTPSDIGLTIVVDGSSFSNPELEGIQIIASIVDAHSFMIALSGGSGFDFTKAVGAYSPIVTCLRPVRFSRLNDAINSNIGLTTGDLVWVDTDYATGVKHWSVFSYHSNTGLSVLRQQPQRVNPSNIVESMLYRSGTTISNSIMIADEPLISDFTIIDPLSGLLAGGAMDQVDYLSSVDPARYDPRTDGFSDYGNDGDDAWGAKQTAKIWWDISTVKFIDPFTDVMGISDERDLTELAYRSQHWSKIAPGCSVDIYEWVESDFSPTMYSINADKTSYSGIVYTTDSNSEPRFAQATVYVPSLGRDTTKYYFWVKNRTILPAINQRSLTGQEIATAIINPVTLNLPWMAPISTDGFVVSGAASYLNDDTTLLKVETKRATAADNAGHSEWQLIRQNDGTSLPPDWLWRKLADSIGAFDSVLRVLPYATLATFRRTGIDFDQNMFDIDSPLGPRLGLIDARESFVGIINAIFQRSPIALDRVTYLPVMAQYTPTRNLLIWSRAKASDAIIAPDRCDYNYKVYTLEQRNALLASSDFQSAITSKNKLRVLVDRTNTGNGNIVPQWSIWSFNPDEAKAVLDNVSAAGNKILTLVQAADRVFSLADGYEYMVSTLDQRNQLLNLLIGDRVLVDPHLSDLNSHLFWTIYQYEPGNVAADQYGFIFYKSQTYDLRDFYSFVDWYAPDYSSKNPPMITYNNAAERDSIEGVSPLHDVVRLESGSGNGGGVWTAYDRVTETWSIVACQNGTVALSSNFFDPSRLMLNADAVSSGDVDNRDGAIELRQMAQIFRYSGILSDLEINEVFFSMINFIHVQQDQVDWIFKTSFMTIAGYNVPLKQTTIQYKDQTANFLAFVNEVKPYHVKVREFTLQYLLDKDTANIHATDFDYPSLDYTKNYLDNPHLIRNFSMDINFDRIGGHIDGFDTASFDTELFDVFERFDGTATDRIIRYYTPTPGMIPNNDLGSLTETDFKGGILDGYTFANLSGFANTNLGLFDWPDNGFDSNPYDSPPVKLGDFDWPINGYDTLPYDSIVTDPYTGFDGGSFNSANQITLSINPNVVGKEAGYQLADPFQGPNRPEERVCVFADDGVIIYVHSDSAPGASPQFVRAFTDLAGNNKSSVSITGNPLIDFFPSDAVTTFFIGNIPQSESGLALYADGVAIPSLYYIINHLNQSVDIDMSIAAPTNTNALVICGYGYGGIADVDGKALATTLPPIREQYFLDSDGTGKITLANAAANSQIFCTINGIQAYATVQDNIVSISPPPAIGNDIAISIYEYGAKSANRVNRQQLFPAQQITDAIFELSFSDKNTFPEAAATFVEVNGHRLAPPLIYYGAIVISSAYIPLDTVITDNSKLKVYIDNVIYGHPVPLVPASGFDNTPFDDVNGYDYQIISPFSSWDTSEQLVLDSNMQLFSLNSSFHSSNIAVMVVRSGDYDCVNGLLVIHTQLNPTDHVYVTTFSNSQLMGIRTTSPLCNASGVYVVEEAFANNYAWISKNGRRLFGHLDYSFVDTKTSVSSYQMNGRSLSRVMVPMTAGSSGRVVVSSFGGMPSHGACDWAVATVTGASDRNPVFHDNNVHSVPMMPGVFDRIRLNHQHTAYLDKEFELADTQITASIPTNIISKKLLPSNIFVMPLMPFNFGIIWIDNERIEYGSLTISLDGRTFVFGNLRRATRGTVAIKHYVGCKVIDASQQFNVDVSKINTETYPLSMILVND